MQAARLKPLTFIDLFACVGGFHVAFSRLGAKCVFASEWDEPARATYEANFRPHNPELFDAGHFAGDITKVDADDIPNFDILCGGFPCQAFSIIGRRRGFADTRGTLFFDVERIIEAKRPRAFFLENVKQLTSHDGGRTFEVILGRLRALGYHVHIKVLNGLDFGVPQRRERIIIVGFDRDVPFEFPTRGLHRPKALTDILDPDNQVDPRCLASDHVRKKVLTRLDRPFTRPAIFHENKSGNIGVHPFSCALRANASYNYLLVNGERRLSPREMFRLQGYPDSFKLVGSGQQLRKQAGNSVVVPKIEAVAHAILEALDWKPAKARATNIKPRSNSPTITAYAA